MIQTETIKAKINFVSVPNDARDFRIATIGSRLLFRQKETNFISDFIDLPQGNWTILNVLDDVTEDEAEMVADDFLFMFTKEGFKSYLSYDIGLRTATESILSLATSLGVEGKTIILYQLK